MAPPAFLPTPPLPPTRYQSHSRVAPTNPRRTGQSITVPPHTASRIRRTARTHRCVASLSENASDSSGAASESPAAPSSGTQPPENSSPNVLAHDDDALQAALSKQWGDLSLFDHTDPLTATVQPAKKIEVEEELSSEDHDEEGTRSSSGDDVSGSNADSDESHNTDDLLEKAASTSNEVEHSNGSDKSRDISASGQGDVQSESPAMQKRGRKAGSKSKPKKVKTTSARKKKATTIIDDNADEPELVPELFNDEEWDDSPRWYFVQVKPSCEQSCAISIRNMSTSVERLDILEVLVPSTKIMRLTKGGKAVEKEERFFPGYILVLMVMNRSTYSNILGIPNVQWFMGDPNRDKKKNDPFRPPLPASDAEMSKVFERIRMAGSADIELKTKIRPGDFIRVTAGQFVTSEGSVLEVKPDINVITCSLYLFGRWSTMELGFDQVEVIDELTVLPKATAEQSDLKKSEGSKETGNKSKHSQEDQRNRRRRVETTVGEVDFSNAGVASSADDLALLLADDASDRWDPEVVQPLPDEARVIENSDADYDEFVSAVSYDDSKGDSMKRKSTGTTRKNKDLDSAGFDDIFGDESLFSSKDDLTLALSKEGEADVWGAEGGKRSKEDKHAVDEDRDSLEFLSEISTTKSDNKKFPDIGVMEERDVDPEVDDILKGVFDDIDDDMDFGAFDDDDEFDDASLDFESNEDGEPGKKQAKLVDNLRKLDGTIDVTLNDKGGMFDVGRDLGDIGESVVSFNPEDEAAFTNVDMTKKPRKDELLDVEKLRHQALRENNLYAHEHGPGHVLLPEEHIDEPPRKPRRKTKSKQ